MKIEKKRSACTPLFVVLLLEQVAPVMLLLDPGLEVVVVGILDCRVRVDSAFGNGPILVVERELIDFAGGDRDDVIGRFNPGNRVQQSIASPANHVHGRGRTDNRQHKIRAMGHAPFGKGLRDILIIRDLGVDDIEEAGNTKCWVDQEPAGFNANTISLTLQSITDDTHRRGNVVESIGHALPDGLRYDESDSVGNGEDKAVVDRVVQDEHGPVEGLNRIIHLRLDLAIVIVDVGHGRQACRLGVFRRHTIGGYTQYDGNRGQTAHTQKFHLFLHLTPPYFVVFDVWKNKKIVFVYIIKFLNKSNFSKKNFVNTYNKPFPFLIILFVVYFFTQSQMERK